MAARFVVEHLAWTAQPRLTLPHHGRFFAFGEEIVATLDADIGTTKWEVQG